MKNILIMLLALNPIVSFAQEQTVLATFKITESRLNGQDNTKFEMDRGGYFAFFTDENGLNLANVSAN